MHRHQDNPWDAVNRDFSKKFGITVYRVVLLGSLWGIFLFLNSHYVRREEFEVVTKQLSEINVTLRLMANQDKRIDDHEVRLRGLEMSPIRSIR